MHHESIFTARLHNTFISIFKLNFPFSWLRTLCLLLLLNWRLYGQKLNTEILLFLMWAYSLSIFIIDTCLLIIWISNIISNTFLLEKSIHVLFIITYRLLTMMRFLTHFNTSILVLSTVINLTHFLYFTLRTFTILQNSITAYTFHFDDTRFVG